MNGNTFGNDGSIDINTTSDVVEALSTGNEVEVRVAARQNENAAAAVVAQIRFAVENGLTTEDEQVERFFGDLSECSDEVAEVVEAAFDLDDSDAFSEWTTLAELQDDEPADVEFNYDIEADDEVVPRPSGADYTGSETVTGVDAALDNLASMKADTQTDEGGVGETQRVVIFDPKRGDVQVGEEPDQADGDDVTLTGQAVKRALSKHSLDPSKVGIVTGGSETALSRCVDALTIGDDLSFTPEVFEAPWNRVDLAESQDEVAVNSFGDEYLKTAMKVAKHRALKWADAVVFLSTDEYTHFDVRAALHAGTEVIGAEEAVSDLAEDDQGEPEHEEDSVLTPTSFGIDSDEERAGDYNRTGVQATHSDKQEAWFSLQG